MDRIIEVKQLKKTYGEVKAVKGIDFYVETGSIFAFLGTNGAGKSTTIEIISTQLEKQSGSVKVANYVVGKDDEQIRKMIGIVFQESLLDPLLSVYENLLIRAKLQGIAKKDLKSAILNAAKITAIEDLLKRKYGKLSGGQKRRVDISRALIHEPKILILDEPTTGLDPGSRKLVWETIKHLQSNKKMTVFLTTHYMEEAAGADYIVVMDKGEIKAKGTTSELKEKHSQGQDYLKIRPKNCQLFENLLQQSKISFQKEKEEYIFILKKTVEALPLIKLFDHEIEHLEIRSGTLDDVFLNLTAEGLACIR